MMEAPQARLQDTIQGGSFLEVRAALQSAQARDRNVASYTVRVLRDDKWTVVFAPKENEAGAIAVRDGAIIPPAELSSVLAAEKQTDSLKSGSLPPILAAADLFEQRRMNLADYRIALLRSTNTYVVTFTDKDSQAGGRGNPGKRLGFEVELNGADLRVIRSHFIR